MTDELPENTRAVEQDYIGQTPSLAALLLPGITAGEATGAITRLARQMGKTGALIKEMEYFAAQARAIEFPDEAQRAYERSRSDLADKRRLLRLNRSNRPLRIR